MEESYSSLAVGSAKEVGEGSPSVTLEGLVEQFWWDGSCWLLVGQDKCLGRLNERKQTSISVSISIYREGDR